GGSPSAGLAARRSWLAGSPLELAKKLWRPYAARVLQHALQHARNHHDLLRDHPHARGSVRQLPYSAHDRRQGHGFSEAEHAVVLVHVAGVCHHPDRLLRRRRRALERLDVVSAHFQFDNAYRAWLSEPRRAWHGSWADLLAGGPALCRHLVADGVHPVPVYHLESW